MSNLLTICIKQLNSYSSSTIPYLRSKLPNAYNDFLFSLGILNDKCIISHQGRIIKYNDILCNNKIKDIVLLC